MMNFKDMKPGIKAVILVIILVPTTILGYFVFQNTLGCPDCGILGLNRNVALDFSEGIGIAKIEEPAPLSSNHPLSASLELRSNVVKVFENGSFGNLVTSGDVRLSNIYVAPNGKIYIRFEAQALINNEPFILAEANPETNELTGINSDLIINDFYDNYYYRNPPIQFDDNGALYYKGSSSDGRTVLQRYHNGEITNLITDNIYLYDFLVLSDGTILIFGETQSTNMQWLRKILPTGGISNIITNNHVQFMRLFPDGNVYVGFWGSNLYGTFIYNLTSNQLSSDPYLSGSGLNNELYSPIYNVEDIFQGDMGCFLTDIKKFSESEDGRVFALSGYSKIVFQFYPTVIKLNYSIPDVYNFLSIDSKLVIFGTDEICQNQLVLYDVGTDTEENLLPNNEFEIYHLIDAGEGILYFDGLNFANNKYAICQLDIETKELTISETQDNLKISDFQKYI